MTPIVIRDNIYDAEEELRELDRLWKEAKSRERAIKKNIKQQTWWDWFWELVGC